MTRVLVVDNYDSFVYTLVGYLQQLGAETEVIRNDDIAEADVATRIAEYDAVLLSPGPGTPAHAGISIPVVRAAIDSKLPLLGVCLGHQAIAEALGATVTHADELMHGKTSQVTHDESDFFAGVPSEFRATRYHSLVVERESLPDCLVPNAWLEDGTIMGLRHRDLPIHGVQFHPELKSKPFDPHPLFKDFVRAAKEVSRLV